MMLGFFFFSSVSFLTVPDKQLTEFASLCKFCRGKRVHSATIYIHNISWFANEVFYRNMQCEHNYG